MKSVLISIKPTWCELIALGKKTVEVRKTRPSIPTPFKCYMYMSKDAKVHYYTDEYGDVQKELIPQRIIGEFVCDKIVSISVYYSDPESHKANAFEIPGTCLSDKQIIDYLGNGKDGYSWHISDLVIYDEPKPLGSFMYVCRNEFSKQCCDCRNFTYGDSGRACCDRRLSRPPQSWCYVEENL